VSYSDLLKDPRWQKMRLQIMERDNWTCVLCGDAAPSSFNVHHLRYIRGQKPWEADPADLVTLCEPCHAAQPRRPRGILTRLSDILPDVLRAIPRISHSTEWAAILERFNVVDRYDPRLCIICHASFRDDLTRCAECRRTAA
jgi:5-methylcytosine-specific restriction endonuclease McrA